MLSIVLYKPLLWMPGLGVPNWWQEHDMTKNMQALVELKTDAGGTLGCLGCHIFSAGSDAGIFSGTFSTVWG